MLSTKLQTPGARSAALAAERPDEIALICEYEDGHSASLSRSELDRWANALARRLASAPIGPGDFVAIHLPNGIEHVVATLAAYKLGACPMPVSHRMPAGERDAMLALAAPKAVISDAPELRGITSAEMGMLRAQRALPMLPDAVSQPFKAIASGGSTGKPKLIVSTGAFQFAPDAHPLAQVLGIGEGDRVYSPGPLYHNQAFFFTQIALFTGASVVISERFDVERAFATIETWRPTVLNLVPTMMLRMAKSPTFDSRDLASIRKLWHMAGPCTEWTKRAWIARIGAARVCELWAATEMTGVTRIDGEEWLRRPGSVGRGVQTEFRIVDVERRPLPAGEVGEIFSRFGGVAAAYRYLGAAQLESSDDGFASVGDLGYLDADGYLFLADRRTDLIISGGVNVYPAEVEAALLQLPGVRDAAVIGLKDDDLGRRVHAIIEPSDVSAGLKSDELAAHLSQILSPPKWPRSFEIVARLPRDEAGKLRRGSLRDERGG